MAGYLSFSNLFITLQFIQFVRKFGILALLIHAVVTTELLRPRGVSVTRRVFYDPSRNFTCLDGLASFPFTYVNDDYCDCKDASDEPGTAACPNGVFHCTNAGYKPMNIPSSWVNDGICDCCDTSDEYASSSSCVNSCKDLGKRAREDAQRYMEVLTKGVETKLEYIKLGKQIKDERRLQIAELQQRKAELEAIKLEKEILKEAAEKPEQEALEKHRALEEEKRKAEEEDRMRAEEARVAFDELDSDNDGFLTVNEIQTRWVFDTDKDGEVSEQEALIFLGNQLQLNRDDFITIGWALISPHYRLLEQFKAPEDEVPIVEGEHRAEGEHSTEAETEVVGQPETVSDEGKELPNPTMEEDDVQRGDQPEGDDFVEDDNQEDESPKFPADEDAPPAAEEAESAPEAPKFDPETQALIDSAEVARKEYNEVKGKFDEVERQLSDLSRNMETDFGPEEEFASLQGQTFEFSDREYTYKLSPFNEAKQKQKNSGNEISLGKWSSWTGSENDKYQRMKYDKGLSCWNGPARSVEVRLSCGADNQITGVSEPSICEYMFEFTTPAVCQKLDSDHDLAHDEL